MLRVWCEWDIDSDDKVFTSEKAAKTFAKNALESNCIDYTEALEEGLIGFDELEVISE